MNSIFQNLNFNAVEKWNGGFKGEISFLALETTNEDWRITFEADFEIRNIWNAKIVSREGNRYVLAPEREGQRFYGGKLSTIGFTTRTANSGNVNVQNLKFGDNSSTQTGSTELVYNVVESWRGGFKSELSFTADGDGANDWRIELDADFDIRGIWGAEVISHNGDRLVLGAKDYNRQLAANEYNKITIVADTEPGETSDIKNSTFYELDSTAGDEPNSINTGKGGNSSDRSGNTSGDANSENEIDMNYNVVESWRGGFKSELSFTAGDNGANDWRIELDADFDIRGIWGAEVISHNGDRLVLGAKDYNSEMVAGETNKITIVADTPGNESSDASNLTFYSSGETFTGTTNPPTVVTPSTNTVNTPVTNTGNGSGQFRYGEAVQKSFLFYEAQRSGDLPNDNRIQWRGDSALGDGSDVGLDLTGGYYDAGDHVKFGMPMASSMAILSWGGVEYETAYKEMGQWDDLLDAVKWGTDWILKAHVNPNGQTQQVYVQVGDGYLDHNVWAPAESMTMNRPSLKVDLNNPGTDIAADYAAALASASMLFKNENRTYANRLINEAKQLYDFAENNLAKYSDSAPGASPYYTSWSGYGDELIWGATWLHKATGEQKYLDKAKGYAQQYGAYPGNSTLSWDDKTAGALVMLAQTGDSQYINIAENWLDGWMKGGGTATYTSGGFAWRSRWGSLRTTASTAFLASVYHETVDAKPEYKEFTESQIDYILGDNPRNSSYVVGFGENPPERAHHRSASGYSFNNVNFKDARPNDNILYGALVGGPKSANDWDWQDDRGDAVGNEVALDYNAGFTGALAYMYDQYGGDAFSDQQLDLLAGIDIAGV